jgi:hypothetical protein
MVAVIILIIYRLYAEIVMGKKQWKIILRGDIRIEIYNKKSLYLS